MKNLKKAICVMTVALVVLGMSSCGKEKMPAPVPEASPTPTPAVEESLNGADNNANYSEEEHIEFLRNRLSNYYDTPTTDYVKYKEEYDDGKLHFIYRAIDKNTNEVLGIYRFPSDLRELERQEADGDFEEIWDSEIFDD